MLVNLRAAIEVKFGSQRAFAKLADVDTTRLNRIVRGWIDPTPAERERCAALLAADETWLFKSFSLPPIPPTATGDDERAFT